MKFVHTFWIDNNKNALEASFGWCSAKYHLMSWALSCLQLNKFYNNVELITDSRGKELLIDKLKLPYKNVRIEMDDLNFDSSPQLWVTNKIYSYTLHNEPFLNVDGDVFIFQPFPDEVLSGDLIAQNIEQDFDYYKELVGLVNNTFEFVPSPIKQQIENSLPIKASNAGILGGHDYRFFSGYYEFVQRFISANKDKINQLTPAQMVNFNAVVEQYIFHCLSNDLNVEVKYLFDTVYDPSFFEGFCNFHYLPNNTPFIHALGDYKKNGWVCDQLANRLRMDYPEYYYRILDLIESNTKYLIGNNPTEEFKNSQTNGSSLAAKYLTKSEGEVFYRTKQIISSICDKDHISMDMNKFTIFQFKDFLDNELTNTSSAALLNDVFEFEKEKLRLIQSLPSDKLVWENELEAINNGNQVFMNNSWQEGLSLRLSPLAMTIESEWDWAQNPILFTRVKVNNVEINFHLEPHYYQTLLLFDKHHVEVIEYLLDPIEAFLLSILSKEEFIAMSEIKRQTNFFFENLREAEILVYLKEAIRFLAYSGVVFIEEMD